MRKLVSAERESSKSMLLYALAIAVAAFALALPSQVVQAQDSPPVAEWNQYGHDAAHTNASEAKGPTWPEVAPGWPFRCPDTRCHYEGLVSAVLNDEPPGAEGRTSLFFGSRNGNLYGLAPSGQYLPGSWPADIERGRSGGNLSTPAVSTSEGEDRIYVMRQGDFAFPRSASIWALGSNGRPLPGWPLVVPGRTLGTPTLAEDAPAPGSAEPSAETVYVPTGPANPATLDPDFLIYALKPDASEKPGWPVRMPKGWGTYAYAVLPPAVGPDGTVYVRSSTSKGPSRYAIFAFTSDGEPKEGWPYIFPANESGGSPSVGSDGTVYTRGAVVGGVPCEGQGSGLYYALSPSGSVKPGWPVRLPSSGSAPAVASDGTTYVKTSCPKSAERVTSLYAIDRNGDIKPGWPLEFPIDRPGLRTSDVALGADGPGNNERIYFSNGGTVLYGYDSHGEPLPGYPIRVGREGNYFISGLSLASDNRLYLTEVRAYAFEPQRYFALRSGEPDPPQSSANDGQSAQ